MAQNVSTLNIREVMNYPSRSCFTVEGALPLKRPPDRADNSRNIEPVLIQKVQIRSALRKGVREPNPLHGNGQRLDKGFGNRTAQPADYRMLFRRDDRAGLTGATLHHRDVQRLDGVHLYHPHREAFGGQHPGRLNRRRDQHSAADNRNVGAVAQRNSFADFGTVIVAEDPRHLIAAESEINGTIPMRDEVFWRQDGTAIPVEY